MVNYFDAGPPQFYLGITNFKGTSEVAPLGRGLMEQ
jgi:hypothetical protein